MQPPQTLDDVRTGGHGLIAICRHCRHRKTVEIERLAAYAGGRQPLLPEPGQRHFSDRMRCARCGRQGMWLWLEPYYPKPRPTVGPNFTIVDQGVGAPYNDYLVVATAENLMVARAAYVAAALFYPSHRIILKQGALLIADSLVDGPPEVAPAEDYAQMRETDNRLAGIDPDPA